MKIGIITFTEGYNYGNKLQNYALIHYLSSEFKCEVLTVRNEVHHGNYINNAIIAFKRSIPSKKHWAYYIRQKKFNLFNKKYLNMTKQALTKNTIRFPEVDIFVCGSDQIWNPNYYENIDPLVGKIGEKKYSFSYAASFGVNAIPKEKKNSFAESISYLKGVSVRENQGKAICEQLGINNSLVNIDPTLLLTEKEWDCIIQKPSISFKKNYIVTYYLGKIPDKVENEIKNYCLSNKCERIDLNSTSSLAFFTIDPCEFLYMIKHAELVFTDSFHASVFSIIFKKKFLVSERIISKKENMNSRIDSLLDLFGLQNHKDELFDGNYESLIIDEVLVDNVLIKERKKSENYFAIHLRRN